jgi:hypothetical protein
VLTFQRSPRDLPASLPFLLLSALAYGLASTVQAALVYADDAAVFRGLADLLLTSAVVVLSLWIGRRGHRTFQTLSAVLGTGAILSVPLIAALFLRAYGGESLTALVTAISLPVLLWSWVLIARILSAALEVALGIGFAIALAYFIASYWLLDVWPAHGAV